MYIKKKLNLITGQMMAVIQFVKKPEYKKSGDERSARVRSHMCVPKCPTVTLKRPAMK